jgi:hypothetical protein
MTTTFSGNPARRVSRTVLVGSCSDTQGATRHRERRALRFPGEGARESIIAMSPILAHLGHWYEVTPYMGPVVIVFLWVLVQSRRAHEDE